jgi:hypothetical protein
VGGARNSTHHCINDRRAISVERHLYRWLLPKRVPSTRWVMRSTAKKLMFKLSTHPISLSARKTVFAEG